MRQISLLGCILLMLCSQAICGENNGEIQELRALLEEQRKMMAEQNAKMAAQDARLSDLQAKMTEKASAPVDKAKGIVSIKKNATVTVGGLVNTRYIASTGSIEHSPTPAVGRTQRSEFKKTDLAITDAKLNFDIKVNDHFEAYLQLDLQHSTDRIANTAGMAQKYYIHWKKIMDTGFGLLIGRNNFIFSDRYNVGQFTGLLGRHDDFSANYSNAGIGLYNDGPGGDAGEGMFSGRTDTMMPNHVGWDYSRTTQINPYWQSEDGKLRVDMTLMQSAERLTGTTNTFGAFDYNGDGAVEGRSINYGLGSGTFRVMWKPIEGLSLTGSVANFYQRNQHSGQTNRWDARRGTSNWAAGHPEWIASNATATNLSLNYNPCFAKSWNFWGKWTHGWNDGWTQDLDSDAFNLGASFAFGNGVTLFAQGDYFTNRNKREEVQHWYRADIWAFYTGLIYKLPYGVNMEFGWRHEQSSFKDHTGFAHTKGKVDTVYGHVGFDF